jgi:hypothetical protein
MMKNLRPFLAGIAVLMACAASAVAQTPDFISFQGMLRDENGVPLHSNTPTSLIFAIANDSMGTRILYSESQPVTINVGMFHANIGAGKLINGSLFSDIKSTGWGKNSGPYWLIITDPTAPKPFPSVRLASVGYAYYADSAGTAVNAINATNATNALNLSGSNLFGDVRNVGDSLHVIYVDTARYLAPTAAASVGVPIGTILAFGGTKIPANYMICDGSPLSIASYQALYSVIRTVWGGNSQTFYLPDLRGLFLRGVNTSPLMGNRQDTLFDPDTSSRFAIQNGGNIGNRVGSLQTDAFQNHSHFLSVDVHPAGGSPEFGTPTSTNTCFFPTPWDNGGLQYGTTGVNPPSGETTASGLSSETRPKNAYVYYIIKYQ